MAAPGWAVRCEALGKQYRLGEGAGRPRSLYETLSDGLALLKRRPATPREELFWALKEVDFEIGQGEVVGVVGRNGAGKSTLLKILSRVTTPTEGRVILRGKLASLLEVGTGFHPELTGRENIFLNGTILGMRRREIERKFDEIVAFAEIERFLDTPVKRYSSGMYVRLAFAIAAHLEPDILIVDEVLAVGDLAFQAKCLGKMEDVAQHGRTILFVSHNLQAVQRLCARSLLLESGELIKEGETRAVLESYVARSGVGGRSSMWESAEGIGAGGVRLLRLEVSPGRTEAGRRPGGTRVFPTEAPIHVQFEVVLDSVPPGLCIGFDLVRPAGGTVLRSYHTDLDSGLQPKLRPGANILRCTIPGGLLHAGAYAVAPRIGIHNRSWLAHTDALVVFETLLTHGRSDFWSGVTERTRPGDIAPVLEWQRL